MFILGRVIVTPGLGCSVEANPKYIRDVTAVRGLEDSRPVATPSVKRRNEPCTGQPWESCCACARSVLVSYTA